MKSVRQVVNGWLFAALLIGFAAVGAVWAETNTTQNEGSAVYLKAPLPNDGVIYGQQSDGNTSK